jgi:acyl-CoA-binding protein
LFSIYLLCPALAMADSIDRVFGHALNTVNKIRPGSQKPPSEDRLALYGLYKQSMEGDVAVIADRPTAESTDAPAESVKKEQEKWDAWNTNAGLTRTEAKRRYVEKLIETMHTYASTTPEARELVEELEFVWDQIKNNSHHPSSGSEHSSPLRAVERSGYIQNGSSSGPGMSSSAAAMEDGGNVDAGRQLMRVLSPVSQAEEDEILEDERDEFVDAPVSQVDEAEMQDSSDPPDADQADQPRMPQSSRIDARWRRRIENNLMKLTTEVAALREQLESSQYLRKQSRKTFFGWVLRLSWWAVQLFVADAAILWFVILYNRRRDDRRLEGAVRVLLGDAVAQVQKVSRDVKMPALPKIGGRKSG